MPRKPEAVRREEQVQRLLRALQKEPKRTFDSLSAEELRTILNSTNTGGRPVGTGRVSPEIDDRYLFTMAFLERVRGMRPEQTLCDLLGIKGPTDRVTHTTNTEYAKILRYYQNHPELYLDIVLELMEQYDIVPATAAELADMPELTLNADELLKREP
jgi:hypothetical protein